MEADAGLVCQARRGLRPETIPQLSLRSIRAGSNEAERMHPQIDCPGLKAREMKAWGEAPGRGPQIKLRSEGAGPTTGKICVLVPAFQALGEMADRQVRPTGSAMLLRRPDRKRSAGLQPAAARNSGNRFAMRGNALVCRPMLRLTAALGTAPLPFRLFSFRVRSISLLAPETPFLVRAAGA